MEVPEQHEQKALPNNLIRHAVTGLAMAAGYKPTPGAPVERLMQLTGDFKRSTGNIVGRLILEIYGAGVGAFFAIYGLRSYLRGDLQTLPFIPMGLVLVGLVLFLVSRNWTWYRFEHGSLTAYRWGHRVLWREDLSSLQMIVRTSGRINDFIHLHWAERKRELELYAALEKKSCLQTRAHTRSRVGAGELMDERRNQISFRGHSL